MFVYLFFLLFIFFVENVFEFWDGNIEGDKSNNVVNLVLEKLLGK